MLEGTTRAAVKQAAGLLLAGELVALPTETVYGLAANALDPVAVAKIFAAKMRPLFDPLIVHVAGRAGMKPLVLINDSVRRQVDRLTECFWPGPLTLVLPRTAAVPDLVAAGLATVAIRAPRHPLFRQVLEASRVPLAAPSANRFGRVSPTAAQHVAEELHGSIPLILDGGATPIGLESTIVRPTGERLEILRPGPVTAEMLREFGQVVLPPAPSGRPDAPGQLSSHYAPGRPVILIDHHEEVGEPDRAAAIVWGPLPPEGRRFVSIASLSERRDLTEAAARLFRLLRDADRPDVKTIYVERVPQEGLGVAIMNRLERAAAARRPS
ncbi:MAG: threonylcarbamoyl-AMP synthase [Verrucomicrobia bacterium]|nr:threonylcarbamoyl-AMP synthase [Verrucomicrobiota bacterium]